MTVRYSERWCPVCKAHKRAQVYGLHLFSHYEAGELSQSEVLPLLEVSWDTSAREAREQGSEGAAELHEKMKALMQRLLR